MFYIKYPTTHKVHMHAGAIRTSVYGYAYIRKIIHPLKLVLYTNKNVLVDFSLTVKAATLIFVFWRDSAISSAKQGKSGSIRN